MKRTKPTQITSPSTWHQNPFPHKSFQNFLSQKELSQILDEKWELIDKINDLYEFKQTVDITFHENEGVKKLSEKLLKFRGEHLYPGEDFGSDDLEHSIGQDGQKNLLIFGLTS